MLIIFKSLLFILRMNVMILKMNLHGSKTILNVNMMGMLLLDNLILNLYFTLLLHLWKI